MDESIKYKLHLIEDAAGKYAVSAKNPTGLVAYYDEGQKNPWRIADDVVSESYATPEQALSAAATWNSDCVEDA